MQNTTEDLHNRANFMEIICIKKNEEKLRVRVSSCHSMWFRNPWVAPFALRLYCNLLLNVCESLIDILSSHGPNPHKHDSIHNIKKCKARTHTHMCPHAVWRTLGLMSWCRIKKIFLCSGWKMYLQRSESMHYWCIPLHRRVSCRLLPCT